MIRYGMVLYDMEWYGMLFYVMFFFYIYRWFLGRLEPSEGPNPITRCKYVYFITVLMN